MIAQGWFTPANGVTLLRVVLTPVVLVQIVTGKHQEAALWFTFAAATDFVDGWLARTQRAASKVGQYLDPIADKFLLSGVFVAFGISGTAPLWFVALVFGRDLALLAASAIAMRVSTYSDYTPTLWGKLSTALQILAAVTILLANAAGRDQWAAPVRLTIWASAAATLWSAIHYTWRGVGYFVRRAEPMGR